MSWLRARLLARGSPIAVCQRAMAFLITTGWRPLPMGSGTRIWLGSGAGCIKIQRVTQTTASAALPPAVPSSCGAATLRLHGVCEPPTFVDATPPPLQRCRGRCRVQHTQQRQ